ncbi:helix-turn-helix transcriptional regulator [Natronomonas sp. EA1]|uniref:helix-turn-helix transcriptional regulator n=1 Tax=Natronomonas sp. EA1 TaxID=3421655 RepID=UPI003EBC7F0B
MSGARYGWVRLLLAVAVVLSLVPAAAGAQPATPEPDATVTRVELHANGSATWTVQIRTRLETDADAEAYRAFQRAFRNDSSATFDPFRQRMERVVASAANETGRPMEATNFAATTHVQEVPRRWGVVTFRFRWTNFAATEDGYAAGDVFGTGFFLSEGDTLEIVAPEGYQITAVEPEPTSRDGQTVRWTGRMDFAEDHPRVELRDTTTRTPLGRTETLAVIVTVGSVLALGAVALWVRRLHREEPPGRRPPVETRTVATPAEHEEPATPDDRIRTGPERVRALLREHGGRMKQAEIADALDWSASKTSRTLSEMAESGKIRKIRLGRENVIDLAEDG